MGGGWYLLLMDIFRPFLHKKMQKGVFYEVTDKTVKDFGEENFYNGRPLDGQAFLIIRIPNKLLITNCDMEKKNFIVFPFLHRRYWQRSFGQLSSLLASSQPVS